MNAMVAPAAMIEVSLVVFVQQDVQAVVVKVVFISKMKPISNLLFYLKMIFAYYIHVPTVVNVFPKVVVDDVYVRHPIMAMIVEKVKQKLIFK
jgi:hypothetical protein